MSTRSWMDSLERTVRKLKGFKEGSVRIVVVGVGHQLRGDDRVGLAVARELRPFANDNLLVVEGGHAPENHTGTLRRLEPDLVLLVDAAELGATPGTVRWLPWQETTGLSASSHTMPPYMLARFLTAELGCAVALIGVQPKNVALEEHLSEAVAGVVMEIVEEIARFGGH